LSLTLILPFLIHYLDQIAGIDRGSDYFLVGSLAVVFGRNTIPSSLGIQR